ncbi:hypothetical protein BDV32DRAFT_131823 [Aspergillus pseudonomiae]|uniref:Uncharacterized protein n=1 Tax=Aspergillus pseudonomiae TaxID=1506151 RepID=A0A5N6HKA5_9EURO|nr:uncharacterized protein BDV37DRAFT_67923 [Aspergillus pseudonomiae]KAB8254735.1 hypothetical protein BDV32DRAFT_131823 [Aspergillus pseudonomiae]KAE8406152.1 hypothetical protein BDV37DRAFT_67923 [Aspergillus pseudonomiae]
MYSHRRADQPLAELLVVQQKNPKTATPVLGRAHLRALQVRLRLHLIPHRPNPMDARPWVNKPIVNWQGQAFIGSPLSDTMIGGYEDKHDKHFHTFPTRHSLALPRGVPDITMGKTVEEEWESVGLFTRSCPGTGPVSQYEHFFVDLF